MRTMREQHRTLEEDLENVWQQFTLHIKYENVSNVSAMVKLFFIGRKVLRTWNVMEIILM